MKKGFVWCVLVLAVTLAAGCGTKERRNTGVAADAEKSREAESEVAEDTVLEEPVLSERETGNGQRQGISVRIYHGSQEEEGIRVNTVRAEEITPEILIWNLSFYGMLPDTVEVKSLRQKEENGESWIELDLSGEFKEWFTVLDETWKHLCMGSLVNTFLDAFGAEKIRVTAEGEALPSEGGVYEGGQGYYAYQEAAYSLKQEMYEGEGVKITYFQFQDMENQEVQDRWNERIQQHVEESANSVMEGGSYEEFYTVKTMNDEILSVLMEGSSFQAGAAYPVRFQYTYNIDMETGANIRLAHYRDVEKIAEDLMNGTGFRTEGEFAEEFQQRIGILYGDAAQLADSLKGYDYGYDHRVPTGYSYQENGLTHLCVEVPHALGDYVDITLDGT